MKKRLVSMLLALVMMLALAAPALAAAPIIKDTEYEGNGYVDVDFRGRVSYKNAKVTVRASNGTKYTARIVEKDSDDLMFYVPKIKAGVRYTYTISGIRSGRGGSYSSVKGAFTVPSKALWIKELEYDRKDRELEIDFSGRVQYKNPKVTVADSSGKTYSCRITDRDSDDMEVRVKGLTAGKQYTVTVSGVRLRGTGAYGTVSGTFQLSKR